MRTRHDPRRRRALRPERSRAAEARTALAGACLGIAGLLTAFAQGCASETVEPEPEWERVETARFVSTEGGFSLELPLGWMRSGQVLTRDAEGQQTITFNAGSVLAGAESAAIEASAPALMQAMRDELSAQPGVQVIDCSSTTLDGLPAFRVHFTQSPGPDSPAGSSAVEHLIYGAIAGPTLYAFSLEAPAPLDFARDLPDFEALVASFRRRSE